MGVQEFGWELARRDLWVVWRRKTGLMESCDIPLGDWHSRRRRGSDYSVDSGLVAGLGAGRGFLAGLEMPMLIMRNLIPVRSVSIALIDSVPFLPGRDYFLVGASGVAGAWILSPRRISTATGGRGLSALASRTVTCHISVSVRILL